MGADVIFTSKMEPLVVELNMAPAWSATNDDDERSKHDMLEDAFALAGVYQGGLDNGYILVAEDSSRTLNLLQLDAEEHIAWVTN
mmetsp:Transcript_5565/g.11032  ORF Transcript_5565/g.11032 Transcript_5565/m.11032 type:complete len:85 (-) Transcript_5565:1377-1631(-)